MWNQTGVTVRKRLSWVVTSVTLTFDLWPWPFAWTSLLSLVITPENFMMIRWWEHSQKGVTDRQTDGRTDGQTDWTIHRAAWSQLKNETQLFEITIFSFLNLQTIEICQLYVSTGTLNHKYFQPQYLKSQINLFCLNQRYFLWLMPTLCAYTLNQNYLNKSLKLNINCSLPHLLYFLKICQPYVPI